MKDAKHLGTLRRSEVIGGILYWPCYLLLLPMLLTLVFQKIGIDTETQSGGFRLNLIFFIVNFITIVIVFRRFLLEQFKRLTKSLWISLQAVILALVFYYLLTVLLNYLMSLLNLQVQNANNDGVLAMVGSNYVVMMFVTVLFAPITEECLCRGLIFCGIYGKSRVLAYALSMLAFAAIHVFGSMFSQPVVTTLICVLQYLPAGFLLAWAYAKSGNIFCPILVHAVINLLNMLAVQNLL